MKYLLVWSYHIPFLWTWPQIHWICGDQGIVIYWSRKKMSQIEEEKSSAININITILWLTKDVLPWQHEVQGKEESCPNWAKPTSGKRGVEVFFLALATLDCSQTSYLFFKVKNDILLLQNQRLLSIAKSFQSN